METKTLLAIAIVGILAVAGVGAAYAYTATITDSDNTLSEQYIKLDAAEFVSALDDNKFYDNTVAKAEDLQGNGDGILDTWTYEYFFNAVDNKTKYGYTYGESESQETYYLVGYQSIQAIATDLVDGKVPKFDLQIKNVSVENKGFNSDFKYWACAKVTATTDVPGVGDIAKTDLVQIYGTGAASPTDGFFTIASNITDLVSKDQSSPNYVTILLFARPAAAEVEAGTVALTEIEGQDVPKLVLDDLDVTYRATVAVTN